MYIKMKRTKVLILFTVMVSSIAVLAGCRAGGVKTAGDTAAAVQEESISSDPAQKTQEESTFTSAAQKTQEESTSSDAAQENQDANPSSDAVQKTQTGNSSSDPTPEKRRGMLGKIPNPPASEGSRILFVGNSHTFTNDLPGMFSRLAEMGGHTVDVYDVTAGWYTLKQFSDPEDEYGAVVSAALQDQKWDFVVLQENTNAALPANAKTEMLPPAHKLDEMIRASGGQTVLLMTWSPEEGVGAFPREIVQSVLSDSYQAAAEELDALLIPGGDVFVEALKTDPELKLWGDDGQHPSPEGTYLAACTAYALIFQETPVGNTYYNELDEETAGRLQEIAQSFMMDR